MDLACHFDVSYTSELDRICEQILNHLLESSLVKREWWELWVNLLDVTLHFQISISESQDVDVDDL